MKTEIYNLIILDESGSMAGLCSHTISGCNETIDTIRESQKQFAETQDHYVSIYAFQSDSGIPSRYLIKNVPANNVQHIDEKNYTPHGCTPLLDAIGSTLVDLQAKVKNKQMAIGNVTIITDGMENSSTQYTYEKVSKMIDALKELGWSFNFIGANIDVAKAAGELHIDNHLEFEQSVDGTKEMYERERKSRMNWNKRINYCMENSMPQEAGEDGIGGLHKMMKDAAKNYFDEE